MASDSPETRKKRRWRWWLFLIVNVAGLVLIFPLLQAVGPLINVWWKTRSQESLRAHQGQVPHDTAANAAMTNAPAESGQLDPALQQLTNKLGLVADLSEGDLQQIIGQQFGVSSRSTTNTAVFDMDSAVFDTIMRTNVVVAGKTYYGYEVKFVDQNGNSKTNIDCFTEPNLEYERSLATMDLINKSPQLRKIYRAMASSLAEKSSDTNSPAESESDAPAFRFEPGQKRP